MFLGEKCIVMNMTDSTYDIYPHDTSYEPMCNVTIVTGASMYTDINTGRLFIIFMNEEFYYGKKLGHSLINPNQF